MEYIGFDARTEKIVTGSAQSARRTSPSLSPTRVVEIGRLGFLAQMDDLITETGGQEGGSPARSKPPASDGKVYALPYTGGGDSHALVLEALLTRPVQAAEELG